MKKMTNQSEMREVYEDFDNRVTPESKPKKAFHFNKKRFFSLLAVLIVIIVAGFVYYKFYYSTPGQQQKRDERTTTQLVKKVSKLMILPKDQKPTVFDIEDPNVLVQQQAFFAGAEKGDKLIVYSESSKAIIYSPKKDMIVNVGPVTFDQAQKADPAS